MNYKNPLIFFDFDDCLVKSGDCQILIKKQDGTHYAMHPKQFYDYELQPGESADYGLFDNEIVPLLIEKMWNIFLNRIQTCGKSNVAIVTARDNPKPVENLLASKGVYGIKVNAVGVYNAKVNTTAINAMNKKNCIRKTILEHPNCDYVEFYDDNRLNVLKVQELRTEFQNIRIKTTLVKH
jgi:hypothetical protein